MRSFFSPSSPKVALQLPIPVLIALVYGILVMSMWGLFAFDRGQATELSFVLNCQHPFDTWPQWRQCLMYGDSLRPYNALYLGLGYLLGLGNGSYISYQLLYGLLWWSKGILVFRIVRRLCPNYPLFAFLVGAIAIVHASDNALNLLGQIHQLGFVVTLLLAIDWWLISGQAQNRKLALGFLFLSLLALYVSLWTYESHFLIILCVPMLLWVLPPYDRRRLGLMVGSWYCLPLIYAGLQLYRYFGVRTTNYQTKVMRKSLDIGGILTDWGTHLQHSLNPWQWPQVVPNPFSPQVPGLSIPPLEPIASTVAAVAVMSTLIGIWLMGRQTWQLPPLRQLWLLLGLGMVWLVLSIPAYLLLEGNTRFYRTQILSSVGAAIVLGGVIVALSYLLPKSRLRPLAAIAASLVIIFMGIHMGIRLQLFYTYRWEIRQQMVSQIAAQFPMVKPNTLIFVTGIPANPDQDPLRDAQAIDTALRVLYAQPKVAAYFFYETGQAPVWNSVPPPAWKFTPQGILWTGTGIAPTIPVVAYNQVIAFRYQADGHLTLLAEFPREILPAGLQVSGYDPHDRLRPVLPDDRAVRIYAR